MSTHPTPTSRSPEIVRGTDIVWTDMFGNERTGVVLGDYLSVTGEPMLSVRAYNRFGRLDGLPWIVPLGKAQRVQ